MFPWKSVIEIVQPCSVPVYVQIANDIIGEIKEGRVQPGSQLPGTRAMSKLLEVHRKTVVAAYDELDAQGWIEIHPSKGAFVNATLPEMRPVHLRKSIFPERNPKEEAGFKVPVYSNIHSPSYAPTGMLGLHDGPDLRLVPTSLVARTYKSVLTRKTTISHLRYSEVEGNLNLRKVLSSYLNESRGLQVKPENIFITRGSQMGMYLAAMSLLEEGDVVLSGDPGYYYAERTFTNFGAIIKRVPVDDQGLRTDVMEEICRKEKIKMIYVTPHHHYPTTVTLCAGRRMELLAIAEKYGIAILEDDYDYDFHYQSSPLLPLASADRKGMVIYIGSLSKTFSQSFRVGFMVAPKDFLVEIGKRRQFIDVQGDWVLEQTFAELFKFGEIQRHMKKALKIYRHRRDLFCDMLQTELGDVIKFKKPEGGMAVWSLFDKKWKVDVLAKELRRKGLAMPGSSIHDKASNKKWNANRMGFAMINEEEMERAIGIIKSVIYK